MPHLTALWGLLASIVFGASTAVGADDVKPVIPEDAVEDIWKFDAAFGLWITSDYMFRGITQTDHGPALQAYFEPAYGPFYAGIFTSNVDFRTEDPDVEVDLYAGVRPQIGPINTDFGYVHYFYPGAADFDYGEAKATASFYPTTMLTLGSAVYYAPDYAQTGDDAFYFEGNAAIAITEEVSVSGALGVQIFGSDVGLSDYATWNVGASYKWNAVTFELRYHDTEISQGTCGSEYPRDDSCEARIVATVKVDTTWSALSQMKAP